MANSPDKHFLQTSPDTTVHLDTPRPRELQHPISPKSTPLTPARPGEGSPDQTQEDLLATPVGPKVQSASRMQARMLAGDNGSRKNSAESSPAPRSPDPSAHIAPSAESGHDKASVVAVDGPSDAQAGKPSNPTPRWPVSPRFASPPPSAARNSSIPRRKPDGDANAPNISQKRTSAPVPDPSGLSTNPSTEKDDAQTPRAGFKTPSRPAGGIPPVLETVSENGTPNTSATVSPLERSNKSSQKTLAESPPRGDVPDGIMAKSGRGSGDSESEGLGITTIPEVPPSRVSVGGGQPAHLAKKSFSSLATTRGRASEPLTCSMTVETETVTSLPQAPIHASGERGVSGKLEANGSVRMKPSTETMKPRKEKRKTSRRPASINTGTVSSKADIFEAKVATAVDEANSSDSDETFVYESNPPEPYPPRSARLHSRTPSATSLTSQIDQRSKSVVREGQHRVAGKRSMKFANYNANLDGEPSGLGGGRGGVKAVSTPRQHHITRHSRVPSHAGLFDIESPFTQFNKLSSPCLSAARSRPTSPRFVGNRAVSSPRKMEAGVDEADEGAADDERMPLMSSVRVNRPRHHKRAHQGSIRQIDYYEEEKRGPLSRYGACLLLSCLFVMLCIAVGALLVGVSKALVDVSIAEIDHVLATEQELMFDVKVTATNPNLFAVTISDLNIDVFAKSGFAGTAAQWREGSGRHELRRRRSPALLPGAEGGVDEGTDPIEDPGQDPQTMVLGRVYEFDSPLTFDSSPLRRLPTESMGEIRLTQPGNRTEEGGSSRWERVIQHPFQLIIGGALKYQLPLSSKTRSVSVRSKIHVDPRREPERP